MNIQRINFILTIANLMAGCMALGFGLAFHLLLLIGLGSITIIAMLGVLLFWNNIHV